MKTKNAFTVVEVVVVVVIIGILTALGIVAYSGIQADARDKSILSDIEAVEGELARYASKNGGVYGAALNWDSSMGANQNISFSPSSGNIVIVTGYGDSYCIQAYNPGSSHKTLATAIRKGQCKVAWDSFAATSELDRAICAYSTQSTLYCWGDNLRGRLGAGLPTNDLSAVPVQLASPLTDTAIKHVDAKSEVVCAITVEDKGYCWGGDSYLYGRIGDGSSTSASPKAISTTGALSGKTMQVIAVNDSSVCAIASDGKAYCWGTGGSSASKTPTAVDFSGVLAGKTVSQLAAGSGTYTYCAIASDQKLYCWKYPSAPQAVSGGALAGKNLTSIRSDIGGYCTLDTAGALYCWGGNIASPQVLSGTGDLVGKTVKSIETVDINNGTCVIASDDKVYCWGTNNTYGQLGNGTTVGSSVPVAVDTSGALAGKTIKKVVSSPVMGSGTMCALTSEGKVYCWGRNHYGQLGNGTTVGSSVPVAVDTSGALAGKTIKDIIQGGTYASCAIDTEGGAYCWGYNFYGQLGNGQSGSAASSSVPVRVSSPSLE